ncbi:MAG: hypothetical protein ACJA0E_000531 [Bermanella sp.]|jgi:hypothetical protein
MASKQASMWVKVMNKQFQSIVGGLCILCLAGCSQLTVRDQMNELDARSVDAEYKFQELPMGMQGDPGIDEQVIELSTGKSFYKAYELSESHQGVTLQLRTYIAKTELGDGFFYPVIELYGLNGKLIEIIKPQLRFTQASSKGRYSAVPISLNREVNRFVIRTEPKLYGAEASYTTQPQGASWSYSVTPFSKRKPASYLPIGKLELLTPDEGFSRPFEKMSGPYWQFSFSRGGQSLASAEEYLPNLTLGGGPILSFGYSWAISGRPSSSIRTSLGGSYYSLSGSGNSSHDQHFLSSDILWVESNQVSSIAVGITARAAHEYKGNGQTFEYEPTFGPKVAIEIRGAMGVSLGAYLSQLTFEDQSGVETKSNQAGLYLMRLY